MNEENNQINEIDINIIDENQYIDSIYNIRKSKRIITDQINESNEIIRKSKRLIDNKNKINYLPQSLISLFHSNQSNNMKNMILLANNPNVYFIDKFLNDNEILYFNKLCTLNQDSFQLSFTENDSSDQVFSNERTSTYIYLSKGKDKIIRNIENKAAKLLSISSSYIEPLQIVSYKNGQKFDLHHDAGTLLDDNTIELVSPKRIATLFIYLNDLPLGEGHTEFPMLGLSIQPKKGSAVLWCNLLPNGEADSRTSHRACPVSNSLRKFGINIWYNENDLQHLATLTTDSTVRANKSSKRIKVINNDDEYFHSPDEEIDNNITNHTDFLHNDSIFYQCDQAYNQYINQQINNDVNSE